MNPTDQFPPMPEVDVPATRIGSLTVGLVHDLQVAGNVNLVAGQYKVNGVPITAGGGTAQTPWLSNINADHHRLYAVSEIEVDGSINITGQYLVNGIAITSGGGSQTPWHSDIDADHHRLHSASKIEVAGDVDITGDYRKNGVPIVTGGGQAQSPWLSNINADHHRLYAVSEIEVDGSINITGDYLKNGVPISTTGGHAQTPWLSDIDADHHRLHEVSGIEVDGSIDITGHYLVNGVSITAGGGSQTPWASDIDGDEHNLYNVQWVIANHEIVVMNDPADQFAGFDHEKFVCSGDHFQFAIDWKGSDHHVMEFTEDWGNGFTHFHEYAIADHALYVGEMDFRTNTLHTDLLMVSFLEIAHYHVNPLGEMEPYWWLRMNDNFELNRGHQGPGANWDHSEVLVINRETGDMALNGNMHLTAGHNFYINGIPVGSGGGGGSQTPWTQTIDGDGHDLRYAHNIDITGSFMVNGVSITAGGGSQTPWLSHIDADDHDLREVRNLSVTTSQMIGDTVNYEEYLILGRLGFGTAEDMEIYVDYPYWKLATLHHGNTDGVAMFHRFVAADEGMYVGYFDDWQPATDVLHLDRYGMYMYHVDWSGGHTYPEMEQWWSLSMGDDFTIYRSEDGSSSSQALRIDRHTGRWSVDGSIDITGHFLVNGVSVVAGGGAQTPWASHIDADGHDLEHARDITCTDVIHVGDTRNWQGDFMTMGGGTFMTTHYDWNQHKFDSMWQLYMNDDCVLHAMSDDYPHIMSFYIEHDTGAMDLASVNGNMPVLSLRPDDHGSANLVHCHAHTIVDDILYVGRYEGGVYGGEFLTDMMYIAHGGIIQYRSDGAGNVDTHWVLNMYDDFNIRNQHGNEVFRLDEYDGHCHVEDLHVHETLEVEHDVHINGRLFVNGVEVHP